MILLAKKEKAKKTKEVPICPKCMKPTLKQAFNVSGWMTNPVYECTNCDYVGSFYLTIDPNSIKDIKKEENPDLIKNIDEDTNKDINENE